MFPNESDPQVTYYFGIVYLDNGEASISHAFDDKEKCIEAIKKGIMKHIDRVVATSYKTYKTSAYAPVPTVMDLFSCPDTRNLMKDKKFMASITA